MKATEITQTVVVRFELDPSWEEENEWTSRRATEGAEEVLMYHGLPYEGEWIETRFMPMGFVEVEYRTVIGLGEEG